MSKRLEITAIMHYRGLQYIQ